MIKLWVCGFVLLWGFFVCVVVWVFFVGGNGSDFCVSFFLILFFWGGCVLCLGLVFFFCVIGYKFMRE